MSFNQKEYVLRLLIEEIFDTMRCQWHREMEAIFKNSLSYEFGSSWDKNHVKTLLENLEYPDLSHPDPLGIEY